jgi:Ca-activated chloride channel family protein
MRSFVTAGLIALTSALAPAALAQERPSTILVLDASGSMWGQIDGINKITIARDVVGDIVSDFPADQNLGFVTYGHRERGQCADIETLVEPAPGTAAEIAGIVEGLNPRGMTPMTDAVVTAAQALRHTEQAATVILVSDGIETCNPDPCAAARALEEAGVDFTAHVIGFDVRGEADALLQMQCIAEETGGRFLTADNAQELNQALREVTAAPASGSFTFTANL